MEFGIEREMLVYNEDLSVRNYKPEELNDNITVDFFDNQIELVSNVHENYFDLLKELEDLFNSNKLKYQKIWPLSQAAIISDEMTYKAIDYKYRKYLLSKYSKEYMSTSGIHINISFKEGKTDEEYFELMKKIIYFSPIMLQFFSFTPVYQCGFNDEGLYEIGKNKGLENSLSLRNSYKYGYINENQFDINYDDLISFNQSIEDLLDKKIIEDRKELYSKVRMKKSKKSYLEIRFIDINPYTKIGISADQMILFESIIMYLDQLDINITNEMITLANQQFEDVATNGLNREMNINVLKKNNNLFNVTNEFIDELIINNKENEVYLNVLSTIKEKYINKDMDLDNMLKEIKEENLSIKQYGLKHIYQKETFKPLYPDRKMELSTKILINNAESNGYEIEIMDELSNAIIIQKENDKEIVIQATKTNKDKYVNILLMENKILSKKILKANNINVAKGIVIENDSIIDYEYLKTKKIVIKPFDTNFGLGITILNKNSNEREIKKAIDFAFNYSQRVIIEEFFSGIEYRFLVINNKLVSVIQRTPAAIIGDGIHTVEELVEIENKNPLRSKGYVTPLELLSLTEIEIDYLKLQNLNIDSVIKAGQKIYLRENSNVSTGGETHEVSYLMNSYFKEIAVNAANAMNVKICGIDMIIDEGFNDYIIVEVNFNPAIQMHTYPVYGIGKNPSNDILNLLFDN